VAVCEQEQGRGDDAAETGGL